MHPRHAPFSSHNNCFWQSLGKLQVSFFLMTAISFCYPIWVGDLLHSCCSCCACIIPLLPRSSGLWRCCILRGTATHVSAYILHPILLVCPMTLLLPTLHQLLLSMLVSVSLLAANLGVFLHLWSALVNLASLYCVHCDSTKFTFAFTSCRLLQLNSPLPSRSTVAS